MRSHTTSHRLHAQMRTAHCTLINALCLAHSKLLPFSSRYRLLGYSAFKDYSTFGPRKIAFEADSCKSRSEPARARPGLRSRAFGVRAAKCRAGSDEARLARQSPAGPTKPGRTNLRPDRRKPDADYGKMHSKPIFFVKKC